MWLFTEGIQALFRPKKEIPRNRPVLPASSRSELFDTVEARDDNDFRLNGGAYYTEPLPQNEQDAVTDLCRDLSLNQFTRIEDPKSKLDVFDQVAADLTAQIHSHYKIGSEAHTRALATRDGLLAEIEATTAHMRGYRLNVVTIIYSEPTEHNLEDIDPFHSDIPTVKDEHGSDVEIENASEEEIRVVRTLAGKSTEYLVNGEIVVPPPGSICAHPIPSRVIHRAPHTKPGEKRAALRLDYKRI